MNKERLEEALGQFMDRLTASRVSEAMRYSLMAGGKRLRPLLLLNVMEGYGVDPEKGMAAACALEMVHTYSLIHDDLPAMDNDDLRRGRPTCHKQFDEATAILAGDALLTYAFELTAEGPEAGPVTACLAKAAGAEGMILGQMEDIAFENNPKPELELLRRIHRNKTGQLFAAPLVIGAILAGHKEDLPVWRKAGELLGLAFQIQDDLFEVTKTAEEMGKSMSDEKNHKPTYVTLLSMEKAETELNMLYEEAAGQFKNLNFHANGLETLLLEIIQRSN